MSVLRHVAAFSLAPAVPALIVGVFAPEDDSNSSVGRFVIGTAYAHAALLGIPVYLVLRSTARLRLGWVLLSAFLIGAVPSLMLFLFESFAPTNSSVGGVVMAQDASLTVAGYLNALLIACLFGLWAVLSGFLWWLIGVYRAR
jgi:hypothetical protein